MDETVSETEELNKGPQVYVRGFVKDNSGPRWIIRCPRNVQYHVDMDHHHRKLAREFGVSQKSQVIVEKVNGIEKVFALRYAHTGEPFYSVQEFYGRTDHLRILGGVIVSRDEQWIRASTYFDLLWWLPPSAISAAHQKNIKYVTFAIDDENELHRMYDGADGEIVYRKKIPAFENFPVTERRGLF